MQWWYIARRYDMQYADKHCFAHDRVLHRSIMGSNFFSALPHFADFIYGKTHETRPA